MTIHFSKDAAFIQDSRKLYKDMQYVQDHPDADREVLADKKTIHRDALELSGLAKNKIDTMNRIKHTVLPCATSFGDTRAQMLKDMREEKGQYDAFDIADACGKSYAKLYSQIEQRYESGKEQYYKADGTPLTKEEEVAWLEMQCEQEVEWQKSCARIAAQREVFLGKIPNIPAEAMEEFEDSFYQAKDACMDLYRGQKQAGGSFVLHKALPGCRQIFEILNRSMNRSLLS